MASFDIKTAKKGTNDTTIGIFSDLNGSTSNLNYDFDDGTASYIMDIRGRNRFSFALKPLDEALLWKLSFTTVEYDDVSEINDSSLYIGLGLFNNKVLNTSSDTQVVNIVLPQQYLLATGVLLQFRRNTLTTNFEGVFRAYHVNAAGLV